MRKKNATSVKQSSQELAEEYDSQSVSAKAFRELEVYLAPRKTLRFLVVLVLGLCLISTLGQYSLYFLPDYPLKGTFIRLFYIDAENNIPSLYSACALLFCAILLATIAYIKKLAHHRYVRHWGSLSIIFLYLAFDEAFVLHEELMEPLRNKLNVGGLLYFAWVIPGAIFVGACLLVYVKFLFDLPAKTRGMFLIAGTLYVGGAMGMELLGGYHTELYGLENMPYVLITTFEELLEMLGIAVFIYALLSYISSYMKGVLFKLQIVEDSEARKQKLDSYAKSANVAVTPPSEA